MLRALVRLIVLVQILEGPDLHFRLVLGDPVGLLEPPRELLAPAGDQVEIVVGQLAPLLLHKPLELLPVPFDDVPIHACPSICARIGPIALARHRARRIPSVLDID